MNFNVFKQYELSVRLQYIENWGEIRDIDNLIMSLEDDDFEISNKASEELVKIGPSVIDKLINATNSTNKDISTWAIITLEQMETISILNFFALAKIALVNHNASIRSKARKGVLSSFIAVLTPIRRSFELIFYFVLITIVQLVLLILILIPAVMILEDIFPIRYLVIKETISSFLLTFIIPFISGFAVSQIIRLKEPNYFLAGIFGIVQNIPYNFLLALIMLKVTIINSMVPIFGLFGAMLGHYYFLNKLKKDESALKKPQLTMLDDQSRTIFLIKERVKMSKKFQDSIITISTILGIILLIYLTISIYHLSSISTNRTNTTTTINP